MAGSPIGGASIMCSHPNRKKMAWVLIIILALSVPPNPNMIIAFPLYGNNQSMKND